MAQTETDWAAAGAELLQQEKAERLRHSLGQALPGNPDKEAELRRAASLVGVPLVTARNMPDEITRRAKAAQIDAPGIARDFPATGAWLAKEDNARLAVDDIHEITQVEAAVRSLAQPAPEKQPTPATLGGAARYLFSANDGSNNLTSDVLGAARSLSGRIGQAGALALSTLGRGADALGLTSTAQDTALGWAKLYADQVDAEAAKPQEFHNKLVRAAADMGLQLPVMLATGGASAAPEASATVGRMLAEAGVQGARSMALPALAESVQTMRQVFAETGDLGQAAAAGQAAYATSVAGAVIPLSAPGGALRRALTGAGVGALQGEATRPLMNAVLPERMAQPFDWENLALNAVTSSLMAGALGPRAEPQRAAAVRAFNEAFDAAHAEQQNQQVVGLTQAANASKLRERDPAAFRQLVGDMADRGDLPPVLHIDATKLAQALDGVGLTVGELAQAMPHVAEQLEHVRAADGPGNVPVDIPIEDWATHIAGSDLEQPLLKEVRVTPEGKTVAEAEAFRQEQQADMQARAEQLGTQHQQDAAYQDSLAQMNAQVDEHLAGLKLRPDQFEANTALLRAFYQVQADRLGIAPHEFAQRYPVTGANKALGDGFEQAAYHGTPHRGIEKFSTDKIGTGEGAQAYGWGLYFASKREVAEHYREQLSRDRDIATHTLTVDGVEMHPGNADFDLMRRIATQGYDAVLKEAEGRLAERKQRVAEGRMKPENPLLKVGESVIEKIKSVKDKDVRYEERTEPWGPGQLYEVEIPDDEHMLHWDKPISEQPEAVRKALTPFLALRESELREMWRAFPAQEVERELQQALNAGGQQVYEQLGYSSATGAGGDRAASEWLLAQGVKGIKYLDGTSRADGEGAHNYVVFSGDDVAIKQQFYQRQQATEARGTYSPSTKTIALLKGANLSTFQHELGHYFLDTFTHLAATLEGQQRDGAGLSDGEQAILRDAYELLRWGGVENLTDWHARDVDQQRELHEKFATGWETYLMQGQAPTLELRSLFARFRAWMISVYKTLKGAPGSFTPEVRGVMDRMIASEEAIREAEAARRYMPLFDDPEKAGMSAEDWAAYQAQGKDATELAIEQLTGKTVRDMARIDRLRAASLKAVQKDAAAKFKEIEREVRAEVMSQPVYRAWAFLTGSGDDDRKAGETRAKGSKTVDPTQDSLLVAIAKLGGLDREAARKDLGVHQDYHRTESGVFGAPVFRKTKGLSAERMAEALAEHHYLPPDYSLHHLEDAINEELHGNPQYSWAKDHGEAPLQTLDPGQITHGKLRTQDLREMFGEKEDAAWRRLSDQGMTSDKTGVHPDLVAELHGFESGSELVRALAGADHPREVVRGLAEQRMLERHGEIATPQAMAREADALVANEVRAQFVATELRTLTKATGASREIAKAAKEVAAQTVGAQRVREIREGRYSAAGTRAAREAEKLMAKGDTQGAAMAKRDQLLNLELARASRDAREWVGKALDYLKKFDSDAIRKTVDPDYVDQIDTLLERFDLRASITGKEIERRASLADWLKAQEALGLEPDLPPSVLNEALRTSYKTLTLDELRGLVDSVKQIEHLGRLKSKLLTAADQRAYEAVRDAMADSIRLHAGDRTADTRTPTTTLGRALQGLRHFGAAHIKAATWARILDGGKDAGPVWEYLIRPANAAGDREVRMRAEATRALHEIMAPLFKGEKMGGKGRHFPSIDRSLNRQERIAIALNTGNAGNLQRLLGGEGWTAEQIRPVLDSITPEEARAVQAIWDHFETYRPLVGEMERRIYGKEPDWVQPTPVKLGGEELRGGYYPVKYDPAASVRAEEHADAEGARRQLQGAYGAATVRRSFAKARAEEVKGRPLLYSLAGVYQGVNETIHALSWSEWLIDANRLLKSTAIDRAVREHYGPEAVRQFKTWRDAVAEGEQAVNGALDQALGKLRQSVSVAGLGFNVMSAAMQPLGFSQSVVRLGAGWAGKGLGRYLASPIESAREARELSSFMAERSRTRFRELSELRNKVQDQGPVKDALQQGAYLLMMKAQAMVDVPTWWGGYEKALAEGHDEARAVALADQAVLDSQGGGQTKDLSAIEMGGQAQRLFTVFYSFMNTALNLGVTSKMTPTSKARMAADMLLLYTVPAVLGALWKDALTPGDSGDYDDAEEAAKNLAGEQVGFLSGLMVVVREFGEAGKVALGLSDGVRDYAGPAGVRVVTDAQAAAKQAAQGEFDTAFRKAAVNLSGDVFGLPSAQINRTITGAEALTDGKTSNPAALLFGYQEAR